MSTAASWCASDSAAEVQRDMVRVRDYGQMQGFVWSSAGVVWSSVGVLFMVKCRALCGQVRGFVFIMFLVTYGHLVKWGVLCYFSNSPDVVDFT
jgi:hypothetical protein